MGNAYSEMKWPFDDMPRKYFKKNFDVNSYYGMLISNPVAKGKMFEIMSHIILQKKILNGEALHIFIEKEELFNFIIGLDIIDKNFVLNFINENKDNSELENYITFSELPEVQIYGCPIVVHHKNNSFNSFQYYIISFGGGGRDNDFVVFFYEKIGGYAKSSVGIDTTNPEIKLLYNLLFYIDAFRDYLIDAPPGDMKIINHYKGDGKYLLKTHPSLLEPGYTTPHFRRGHFRYLTSEHFIKKRFQTVFVRSSFIHGDAKTVIGINNDSIN
jgi:hypothetical protein